MSAETFKELLPFYVYLLIDPLDQSVFYVGKGKNYRALSHVEEVKEMMSKGNLIQSPKHRKILDILNLGGLPIELIVARFESEEEAFAVESVFINFVYGFENLTNLVRGHDAEFVRRKNTFERIEGIDIPKPTRNNDGAYANAKLEGLRASGAYELLDRIKYSLSNEHFIFRDFSLPEDKPFHPGKTNGWLGLILEVGNIDLIVSFTKECRLCLSVANTPNTRNSKANEDILKIEKKKGANFQLGLPKNIKVKGEGRYRDFGTWMELARGNQFVTKKPIFEADDFDQLLTLLNEFRWILKN